MTDNKNDGPAGKAKASKTKSGSKEVATPEKTGAKEAYLVLARKYRPADFSDLIGQEPMVQTLRNAFQSNRIAQGYMLSGVRGVGKTTTARILARALNYETETINQPTIDMDALGVHCPAIMAGTHVDVMEMDAASHTGIDDIREIIEAARYKPVSARYKVYIIDEVHMLSKSAFNGLLKTLEEPPAHVKFIFATTELRKVPVTVLSRCQRFDLRRIDIRDLETHFKSIAEKEAVNVDDDAISLIARAAEGSVRDGLSLLDQAFARAEKDAITAENIRSMLGLADQAEILTLLSNIFSGKAPEALSDFHRFYHNGGDPQQIISELAEAVHLITRTKALGGKIGTDDMPEAAQDQIIDMAEKLSMAILNRGWQTLLKGYEEVGQAPNQVSAAEMIILRLLYMSDLPAPGDLIEALRKVPSDQPLLSGAPQASQAPSSNDHAGNSSASHFDAGQVSNSTPESMQASEQGGNVRSINGPDSQPVAQIQTQPQADLNQPPTLDNFAAIIDFLGQQRDVKLKLQLEQYAELVSFAPGRIELHLLEGADDGLALELSNKLTRLTGTRWMVALSHQRGEETLGTQRRIREENELQKIKTHPAIIQTLEQFPGAEIIGIKPIEPEKTVTSITTKTAISTFRPDLEDGDDLSRESDDNEDYFEDDHPDDYLDD